MEGPAADGGTDGGRLGPRVGGHDGQLGAAGVVRPRAQAAVGLAYAALELVHVAYHSHNVDFKTCIFRENFERSGKEQGATHIFASGKQSMALTRICKRVAGLIN